jgi:hypothetical protein
MRRAALRWRRAVAKAHRNLRRTFKASAILPKQDRECCGHKREIYPRAVQGEIRDRDKEQRKQRNSRHSGDSSYQLNSPVSGRFNLRFSLCPPASQVLIDLEQSYKLLRLGVSEYECVRDPAKI